MFKLSAILLPLLALSACDVEPPAPRDGDNAVRRLDGEQAVIDENWVDPNLYAAGECTADPDSVLPGDEHPAFVALARDVVELNPGTSVVQTDADRLTVYPPGPEGMQKGNGINIDCRCDSGCTGVCEASYGPNTATCTGSCSGKSDDGGLCGGCSFHFGPLPGSGTSAGTVQLDPDPVYPIPLPTYPTYPSAQLP